MHTRSLQLILAALACIVSAGACAGESAQWRYAPLTVSSQSPSSGSESPGTAAGTGPPAKTAAPAEARIIEMKATAALQFTTPDGTRIEDLQVTPGETVIFRIDNTFGYVQHSFYIGTDEELGVPSGSTETGIPPWGRGVREVEWVVPEDISGLKFACTVPGHFAAGMQGTFSVAP